VPNTKNCHSDESPICCINALSALWRCTMLGELRATECFTSPWLSARHASYRPCVTIRKRLQFRHRVRGRGDPLALLNAAWAFTEEVIFLQQVLSALCQRPIDKVRRSIIVAQRCPRLKITQSTHNRPLITRMPGTRAQYTPLAFGLH